ncbi:MAG: TetR family transcriptional regulator C-terminal domain-containing protein [Sphingomonas sp.]
MDPEQKRREFVAASWDVIATEGLSAATLRRVAAAAGCTTGSLTHYFSDRSALLVEALRAAHFATAARMLVVLGSENTPVKRVRGVLHEALPLDATRLREWKVWIAFWAALTGEAELAAENARRYDEWREMVEELLSPLFPDPLILAEQAGLLIAMIDGLGVRLALTDGDAATIAEARRRCVTLLDRYLILTFSDPAGLKGS